MQNNKGRFASLRWIIFGLVLTIGFTSQAAALQMEDNHTKEVVAEVTKEENAQSVEALQENLEFIKQDIEAQKEAEEAARIAEEQARAQAAAEEQARIEAEARAQAAAQEQAEAEAAQAAQMEAISGGYDESLLAAIIYCEAGNQSYEGQVAVGAVVMNRIRSESYPGSMEEVIYQSGQFGPAVTGWLDSVRASEGYTESALQAARDAIAGANPIGDCLYFDQGGYGMQIGDHYFH